MDLGLKGTIAIVAGSSRGLGYAVARTLSEEGASLVINGRESDGIIQTARELTEHTGHPVFGIGANVATPQGCQSLVDGAIEHFGGLDILITNAGGPPAGTLENLSEEQWFKAFELTFMSNVRLIKAALPALRKSKVPSVVTITSLSVKQPIKNLLLSNSLRAGVLGLTKSLALELGEEGIRFNCLLPGWTLTERVGELMLGRANANGTSIEEETLKQAAESPFKRMASPEEFASAAVFLASPRAAYITGINLSVDGGMIKSTF